MVLAYALAEQRGDGQTAWELLATTTQARGDHERFLARVGTAHNEGYLTTQDERLDGESASVTLVHTYPGSNAFFGSSSYASRNTVRLVREPAGWRITVPPDDYALLSSKP